MVLLFWVSCAVVVYVYAGYPALLMVWARLRPRPIADTPAPAAPGVSIVIAERNEGQRLANRLDNLLQLAYPSDRRQIIVVSDGSTDETLGVLRRYQGLVDAVSVEARGKALALNAGVARAKHEILVFADARQVFAGDAIVELTSPFRDPKVGAVTGELLLDGESQGRRVATADRRRPNAASLLPAHTNRRTGDRRHAPDSAISDGVGLYWRYEKHIRRLESSVGSTLGATGAIYAMRRSLWVPLPADTILDDVLAPMRAVLAGYRTVFNDKARAFDRVAPDADAEARRKVRTLAGNFQVLWLEPRLLLPWRNPVWLQYMSHKIGRLVVPYALMTLLAASMAVADRSIAFAAALAAQCVFYLLAGYGAWLDMRGTLACGRMTPVLSVAWPSLRRPDRQGAVNV